MAYSYNVRNNGQGGITLGMKAVNSYNVAPATFVALATPNFLTIPYTQWLNFDWFNAQQTGAATDGIFLPTLQASPVGAVKITVGSEFRVFAISALKVSTVVDTVASINGVVITSGTGIAIPAGGYGIFTAISTSGTSIKWVAQVVSSLGVVTSPAPA